MDIVETILNYRQNWIQVSNLTQLLLLTLIFITIRNCSRIILSNTFFDHLYER